MSKTERAKAQENPKTSKVLSNMLALFSEQKVSFSKWYSSGSWVDLLKVCQCIISPPPKSCFGLTDNLLCFFLTYFFLSVYLSFSACMFLDFSDFLSLIFNYLYHTYKGPMYFRILGSKMTNWRNNDSAKKGHVQPMLEGAAMRDTWEVSPVPTCLASCVWSLLLCGLRHSQQGGQKPIS